MKRLKSIQHDYIRILKVSQAMPSKPGQVGIRVDHKRFQVQNSNGYVRNVVTCGGVKPSVGWSSRSVMFSSNPLFVILDDPLAADERESRSSFNVIHPEIVYN